MPEKITPVPLLDQQTAFLTFQVRVGPHLVTIERSNEALWIKLPGIERFALCIDLYHMPGIAAQAWQSEEKRHGNPQVLLYNTHEDGADDPIARAIFSTTATQLLVGENVP